MGALAQFGWNDYVLARPVALLALFAIGILPALQKPTISSLSDDKWVAVNTILDENIVRHIIPQLKQAVAQGIVEYPLNKIIA